MIGMFALNSSFSSAKRHDVVGEIDCLVRITIHCDVWERRLKVLNDKEGIDNENKSTGINRSMTIFEACWIPWFDQIPNWGTSWANYFNNLSEL